MAPSNTQTRPPNFQPWSLRVALAVAPVYVSLLLINVLFVLRAPPFVTSTPAWALALLPTTILLLKCIWLPAKAHGRTKQGDELAMPVTLWLLAIDLILTSFLRAH